MDEILIDRFTTDTVLMGYVDKLNPERIPDGGNYPAVAYNLAGDTIRCSSGIGNFSHDLMFLVEAKSKREVIEIKNAIIQRFDRWNYLSLLGYTDTYENVTKTYMALVTFKINKTVIT